MKNGKTYGLLKDLDAKRFCGVNLDVDIWAKFIDLKKEQHVIGTAKNER